MSKKYVVWANFDGAMRIEVEANSPEEAITKAEHPSNSLKWEIDHETIMWIDHPLEAEEIEETN